MHIGRRGWNDWSKEKWSKASLRASIGGCDVEEGYMRDEQRNGWTPPMRQGIPRLLKRVPRLFPSVASSTMCSDKGRRDQRCCHSPWFMANPKPIDVVETWGEEIDPQRIPPLAQALRFLFLARALCEMSFPLNGTTCTTCFPTRVSVHTACRRLYFEKWHCESLFFLQEDYLHKPYAEIDVPSPPHLRSCSKLHIQDQHISHKDYR